MSGIIRHIDLRTMSGTNTYYIVFAARGSSGSSGKPGHAFVVWGTEDSGNSISVQKAWGLYPDASMVKAIFGTVPGNLANEAFVEGSTSTNFTARLIVKVNSTIFKESQEVINDWKTSDYNLYAKNCIHFCRNVAVRIALFPPDVGLFELPEEYLKELINNSTS
jgi:hypothetical protein